MKRNKKTAPRAHSEGHNSSILPNLLLVLQVSGVEGTRVLINILPVLLKAQLASTFLLDHSNIKHIGPQVKIK